MSEFSNQVELSRKHQSMLITEPKAYLEGGLLKMLEIRKRLCIEWEMSHNEEEKKNIGTQIEWVNSQMKFILDIF